MGFLTLLSRHCASVSEIIDEQTTEQLHAHDCYQNMSLLATEYDTKSRNTRTTQEL